MKKNLAYISDPEAQEIYFGIFTNGIFDEIVQNSKTYSEITSKIQNYVETQIQKSKTQPQA